MHRAFSILNHYLKRAPSTRVHALSAYLRVKQNPCTISTAAYSKHKNQATSELYDTKRNGKSGFYKKVSNKHAMGLQQEDTVGDKAGVLAAHALRVKNSRGKMDVSEQEAAQLALEQERVVRTQRNSSVDDEQDIEHDDADDILLGEISEDGLENGVERDNNDDDNDNDNSNNNNEAEVQDETYSSLLASHLAQEDAPIASYACAMCKKDITNSLGTCTTATTVGECPCTMYYCVACATVINDTTLSSYIDDFDNNLREEEVPEDSSNQGLPSEAAVPLQEWLQEDEGLTPDNASNVACELEDARQTMLRSTNRTGGAKHTHQDHYMMM